MESLIPNIDYAAALAVLEAHMSEIEHDLPELAYYRLREMREISGVAAETLLEDATARLIEARGNAEAALIQAESMALTIAQNMQLSGFGAGAIGTYTGGDFTHTFLERAVFPLTPGQRAKLLKDLKSSGVPVLAAMRMARYTAAEILAVEEERTADRSAMLLSAAAYLTQERETQ